MTAAPKFQNLKLSDVVESTFNPRKEFDKTKLAELTASVKEKGVLEPILVRPLGEKFQVVAGARRFRSAVEAELETIPAMVRVMTDAEALEVALLENVVRHDISALEEGDAYRALTKEHGYTIEQLVEKTGKSRTVVFQRMKLAELQGKARKLLVDGGLSASIAELIARLPTKEMQDDAIEHLKKSVYYEETLATLPFRRAKESLDRTFRLVLDKAPFDTKSEGLCAGVPACGACPKRTGFDKALFPDVKKDTCLDSVCWSKKEEAGRIVIEAQAKADGIKVVVDAEAIVNYGQGDELSYSAKDVYSKQKEKIADGKTWGQLLGEKPPLVRVLTDEGNFDLIDKPAALKLLKEKSPKVATRIAAATSRGGGSDSYKEQQKRESKKRKQARVHAKALLDRLDGLTLEKAVDAMVNDWSRFTIEKTLEFTGQKKTDIATPAGRVRFIIGSMLGVTYLSPSTVSAVAAAVKVDLKKLQKELDDVKSAPAVSASTQMKLDAHRLAMSMQEQDKVREPKKAPAEKAKKTAAKKPKAVKKAKAKKAVKKGKKK